MSLYPASQKRISRELADVLKNPVGGVTVMPSDTIERVDAEITGPEDTPFAGGRFEIRLVFGAGYPDSPPSGYFITKVFHPNVSDRGEICVNTLKRDWQPELGLRHVLMVIRCLLIEPNPESALNEEAGRLLLEDYGEYCRRARMLTCVHAIPKTADDVRPLGASGHTNRSTPAPAAASAAKEPKRSVKKSVRRL